MNPTQDDYYKLLEHMGRLERRDWWWKRAVIFMGVGVCGALLLGAANAPETLDELWVKKLVVVGKDGKSPRLIVDGQSRSLLLVKDANGTSRFGLVHEQRQVVFHMLNDKGKLRVAAGYDPGQSFFTLCDRTGRHTKVTAESR
jgi:hypothetical protein